MIAATPHVFSPVSEGCVGLNRLAHCCPLEVLDDGSRGISVSHLARIVVRCAQQFPREGVWFSDSFRRDEVATAISDDFQSIHTSEASRVSEGVSKSTDEWVPPSSRSVVGWDWEQGRSIPFSPRQLFACLRSLGPGTAHALFKFLASAFLDSPKYEPRLGTAPGEDRLDASSIPGCTLVEEIDDPAEDDETDSLERIIAAHGFSVDQPEAIVSQLSRLATDDNRAEFVDAALVCLHSVRHFLEQSAATSSGDSAKHLMRAISMIAGVLDKHASAKQVPWSVLTRTLDVIHGFLGFEAASDDSQQLSHPLTLPCTPPSLAWVGFTLLRDGACHALESKYPGARGFCSVPLIAGETLHSFSKRALQRAGLGFLSHTAGAFSIHALPSECEDLIDMDAPGETLTDVVPPLSSHPQVTSLGKVVSAKAGTKIALHWILAVRDGEPTSTPQQRPTVTTTHQPLSSLDFSWDELRQPATTDCMIVSEGHSRRRTRTQSADTPEQLVSQSVPITPKARAAHAEETVDVTDPDRPGCLQGQRFTPPPGEAAVLGAPCVPPSVLRHWAGSPVADEAQPESALVAPAVPSTTDEWKSLSNVVLADQIEQLCSAERATDLSLSVLRTGLRELQDRTHTRTASVLAELHTLGYPTVAHFALRAALAWDPLCITYSLQTVTNLGMNAEMREELWSCIELSITALTSSCGKNQRVAKDAIVTLRHLSYENDNNKSRIIAAGGLPAILDAMQSFPQSAQVQRQACMALRILSVHTTQGAHIKKTVLSIGGLPVLFEALSRHLRDPSVSLAVLQVMSCLLHVPDARHQPVHWGGKELLEEVARYHLRAGKADVSDLARHVIGRLHG
jgi:hypothetical protein